MTQQIEHIPWATRELGFDVLHVAQSWTMTVPDLVKPGLRRNPRRAQLLVSTVLGKHIATDPSLVIGAGNRLGDLVRATLGDDDAVVLGFCETATGLGHCVATRIAARFYLHSTRRVVPNAGRFAGFEEDHCHAPQHLLQPSSAELFANDLPLVLVDDEISTGATAVEAIRALHRNHPRSRYVIASLVDMRTEDNRLAVKAAAAELNTQIDSVSLAAGAAVLPDGLIDAVAALPDPLLNPVAHARGRVARVELPWPEMVPDGGRHGLLATDADPFDRALTAATATLAGRLDPARPVIVLGHEELMYLPVRIAESLAVRGIAARFQTTTRVPAYVLDEPGYPLRRGFRFTAPEDGEPAPRFLYNATWPDADPILVHVIDPPADTPRLTGAGGVLDVLTAAGHDVLVATLPGVDPARLRSERQRSEIRR